jgi:hypothetical protein
MISNFAGTMACLSELNSLSIEDAAYLNSVPDPPNRIKLRGIHLKINYRAICKTDGLLLTLFDFQI